jgi:hypothetical protein
LLGVVDIIAARTEALSKYGGQSFILPPPHPSVIRFRDILQGSVYALVYIPPLCLGVGRHQVIPAMKLRNVSESLVMRINAVDPNSFMARALSRYDPNKHGFAMYFCVFV